jgi:hypothetical protein
MNFSNTLKSAALVVAVASTMLLSACGSSGAPASDSSSVPGSVNCTANQNTVNNSANALNQIQKQIQNANFPQGGGEAGSALLCSGSHVLQVTNDLVAGLKAAAAAVKANPTDPSAATDAINPYLQNIGPQLHGAAGNLVLALLNLQQNLVNLVPQSQVAPLNSAINTLVGALQGVETNLVNGYAGGGTVDLTALTNALTTITGKLGPFLTQLNSALSATGNVPVLGQVVISLGGVLNTAFTNLNSLLGQVGNINSPTASANISNGISTLVNNFVNGLIGLTGSTGKLGQILGTLSSPLTALLSSVTGPGGTLTALLNSLLTPGTGLLSGLLNSLFCPLMKTCQSGSGGGVFGG